MSRARRKRIASRKRKIEIAPGMETLLTQSLFPDLTHKEPPADPRDDDWLFEDPDPFQFRRKPPPE